jgi:MFS family permease
LSLLLLWLTRDNLRLVVWLAFIPGAVSVYFVSRLREVRRVDATQAEPAEAEVHAPLGSRFRWYVGVWAVFAVSNSSDVFIILRAKDVGLSTTAVLLLYVLYNVVYAIASPRLGALSDRLGRRVLLFAGLVVFAAVYAGLAVASAAWQLVVLFAVYGLYMAATEGVGKALAVDLVPAGVRAAAVGVLGMVTGIATLLASVIAGVLWSTVGPWAAFAFGAVGAILAAGLLVVVPALRHA